MACKDSLQFKPEGTILDTPGGKQYGRFLYLIPPLEVPKMEEKMRLQKESLHRMEKCVHCLTTQQTLSMQYA